jgi:hypothetical protein
MGAAGSKQQSSAGCKPGTPADQQDEQQQQQQQQQQDKRPHIPWKVSSGLYRRKDYAAACPEQHVAYLRCLQHSAPLSWNACKEEYDAFDTCVQSVTPAHLKTTGAMTSNAWQQLKKDPLVLAIVSRVQELIGRLGFQTGNQGDGSSNGTSGSSMNSSRSSGPDS